MILGSGQEPLGALQYRFQGVELLLKPVGSLALLGLEVLGTIEVLEKVSVIFIVEDGVWS